MFLKDLNSVLSFQKKLYLNYLKKVYRITGKNKTTLSNYELEFKSSLPRNQVESSYQELLYSINNTSIILFGDFHTLINTQNLLIKTIRLYKDQAPNDPIIIALEAFFPSDRAAIDLYLKEKINDEEFLELTQYYKKWGFPWSHYKKIFTFAKQINASIIPINSCHKNVYSRDSSISKILFNEHKIKNPLTKIFCLIGEFHLAEKHLHQKLIYQQLNHKKKIGITRILSNVDHYFFDHKIFQTPSHPGCLNLSNNYYCLLDTPPWIKWHTYTEWEESGNHKLFVDKKLSLKSNEYLLLHPQHDDIEHNIAEFVKTLALFFSTSVDISRFFNYKFIQIDNNYVEATNELTVTEKKFMKQSIKLKKYYISDKLETIFYSQITLGSILSCSGQILFFMKSNHLKSVSSQGVFYKEIFKNIFSSLVELIFNPYAQTVAKPKSTTINPPESLLKRIDTTLDYLENSNKEDPSQKFQFHIEEQAKNREEYWIQFARDCGNLLFSQLIYSHSKTQTIIKNNILEHIPQFCLKSNMINILRFILKK